MWRQISTKSARQSLRRCASTSGPSKPIVPPPAAEKPLGRSIAPAQPAGKPLKSDLTLKSTPAQKSGGGAVYGLLFTTVGITGGFGYYIQSNPEFNPNYLKDNEAFSKFREFVLSSFPSSKAGLAPSSTAIVIKDTKTSPVADKPKVKDTKEIEKATIAAKKTKAAEEAKVVKSKKEVVEAKKVEVKEAVKTAETTVQTAVTEVKAAVAVQAEDAETKAEAALVKAEGAVKAEVAKVEAVAKTEAKKAATALQKKLDDAAAKEQAVIDALNQELVSFEEKAKEASAATKNKVVKKARAESEALSEELDHTILAGIKELDADSLRLRVAQLATEMKNRTKWEAVRMMESLKRMEEEVHAQHTELLRQQDVMHKELLVRELRLQEELITRNARMELEGLRQQHDAQIKTLVGQEKALIQADFDKKLVAFKTESEKKVQAWVAQKAAEIQAVAQKEQEARIQELEAVRVQVKAINELLGQTSNYEAFSHQVHKVSVAALALTNRIEAAAPLHNEIRALRAAGNGDNLIETAVQTLAPFADGAPSVAQLQDRFKVVQKAARQAALVPEQAPGMVGHLFANALHFFIIPPGGPIKGDDAEAIFSRADFALRGGDIESAVSEVEKLSGLPRDVVSDWVAAAKSRLAVEQTAKVVKAHISLLAASLS
ncbi:Aste57867_1696 [Aphanomyces stellatus]|uniref:Aste57867_1696 protein n=1 Tax=Aphanomyces stellatus TaxID=120398 RepID=A0A485K6B0_9STRA|nr:hypothetical protein As57867_001694 [Aphanomyces stellatus]VFT78907.1 Aste57867_1696 [Aphanomyces stellatus]